MEIINLFDKETPPEIPYDIYSRVTDTLQSKRELPCHKGDFGTLACICGSYGMAGAAMMCASAAVTTGSGLVKLILPSSIYPIAASNLWEAVFLPLEPNDCGTLSMRDEKRILDEVEKCTVVAIGCGLGVNDDTRGIVLSLLKNCTKPIVLDADGINCLCGHINVLRERKYPTILTPHPGEMARLLGKTIEEVQNDRENIAVSFSQQNGCTLVLKGYETVTALGGKYLVNDTGNGCLAKGGSGDVLTGMIAALLCQGTEEFDAAVTGVYLHGLAAQCCTQEFALPCVTARDVITAIKYLM